jgi:hypothetical protein
MHLDTQKAQKSVNLKYSFMLTGMFRSKTDITFVEWYRSYLSCALDMEDLISCNIYFFISVGNKEISNVFLCTFYLTLHLTFGHSLFSHLCLDLPNGVFKNSNSNFTLVSYLFDARCIPLVLHPYLYLEQKKNYDYIQTVYFSVLLKVSPCYMQILFSVSCFKAPLTYLIIIIIIIIIIIMNF